MSSHILTDISVANDQLYRSYDTRIRPTERSSDLYIKPGWAAEDPVQPTNFHWYPPHTNAEIDEDEKAKIVLDISDSGELLPYGKTWPYEALEGNQKRDWVWRNRGRLLIISVPFRVGRHDATKLSEFRPLLHHLHYLHSNGIVHGDIRAFNLVFDATSGWLIDFDFGGVESRRCLCTD